MDGEEEESARDTIKKREEEERKESGYRLDLRETVEIEINSPLDRLFDWGRYLVSKTAYEWSGGPDTEYKSAQWWSTSQRTASGRANLNETKTQQKIK